VCQPGEELPEDLRDFESMATIATLAREEGVAGRVVDDCLQGASESIKDRPWRGRTAVVLKGYVE
jgi:hypothetical protein